MSDRASLRAVPYVAVRWPESHIVFRLVIDGYEVMDGYEELRERVTASVREALADLRLHVIEEGEESIEAAKPWVWVCKRHHSDGDDRLVVVGGECPNCGATEPLDESHVFPEDAKR